MKQPWTVEAIVQAYHDQGVSWPEEEIWRRAGEVASELQRMDDHWAYLCRKARRFEVLAGLHPDEERASIDLAFKQTERLLQEDWGERRPSSDGQPPPSTP